MAGWPFDFGQTVILIPVIATAVTGIVSSVQLKKVHTLVNQKATDQDNKIKKLEDELLKANEILAERIKVELAAEIRAVMIEELKVTIKQEILALPLAALPQAATAPVPVVVMGAETPVPVTVVASPPLPPRP